LVSSNSLEVLCKNLPPQLASLRLLFSRAQATQRSLASLPAGLRELVLLEMHLPGSGMGASGAVELGRFISRCAKLRAVVVDVSSSMLFAEGASAICRAVAADVQRVILNLSRNELGPSGCRQVAQDMRRWGCSSLGINLSENGAFGTCVRHLCDTISNMPLTQLTVRAQHCHLSTSEVEKLWQCCVSLRSLTEIRLDLAGNRAAVGWLPPAAWPDSLLRLSIDFSENPGFRPALVAPAFSGVSLSLLDLTVGLRGIHCMSETASFVFGAFAELRALRRCRLDFDRIRGGSVPVLIRGFTHCPLVDFSLSAWDCDLRDAGAAAIGEAVASWSLSLVQVSLLLTSNGIGAPGARRLASGVAMCSQLSSVHVEAGWGPEPFVWWDLQGMRQWLGEGATAVASLPEI